MEKQSKAELFFSERFTSLSGAGDDENETVRSTSTTSRPPLQDASGSDNSNNKIHVGSGGATAKSKIADLQSKLEQAMAVVMHNDAALEESQRERDQLEESLADAIDRVDALQAATDETNSTVVPNLHAEVAHLRSALQAAAADAATAATEKEAAAKAAQIKAAQLNAALMAAREVGSWG